MTQTLESQLRDALAARAQEIPNAPAERLRAHDYRPRTRDLRPPVAAGALLTAGAAAAAVLIVGLGPRAPAAFAGWTPAPTTAPAGQVNAAEVSCQQRLAAQPTPPPGGATITPAPTGTAGMSPVLADTRGPFTFVIFAGGTSSATCISGPSFTSVSATRSSSPPPAVPAGQILLSGAYDTARAGNAYSFAEGHTGAGVTATSLILDDGTHVQASSDNGWFVAWWPGSSRVVSAEVTTATGTATQHLATAPGPPCPAPPARDGGTVACASGSVDGGGAQSGSVSVSRSGS